MSFDIQIKVDPGNAAAAIKGVTDGLTQTEQRGKAAGAAMAGVGAAFKSLAQAIQQEQAALTRLNTVHDQLAVKNSGLVGSFRGLAEAMQREQAMLEQINGPARQYMEDLTALDSLLQKNKISTEQYAAQVTKLNQATSQTAKPEHHEGGDVIGQVAGGIGGSGGEIIGAVAGGSMVAGALAGVSAISEYIEAQRRLEDEYTTLINQEMKFTDGMHSLSSVMSEQTQLADDLHATLKETGAAYDAVQDATVGLNLSSRDTADLTRAIGQAAVISGKSMESAGDVLNRMTLAMDSGADSGKALKQALVGYDAISEALTAHFHTTREGLVQLVNAHKIGSRDIIEALKAEGDAIQEQFDKRKVTNEQEKAMIEERANLYHQMGAGRAQAALMALNKGYADAIDKAHQATDAQYGQQKALDEALPKIEQLTKDLQNQAGAFAEVGKAEAKAFDGALNDINAAIGAFGLLGTAISTALGHEAWAGIDDQTGLLKFLPLGTKTAMEFASATAANKRAIDDLNAAYVAGAFGKPASANATAVYLAKIEALTAGLAKNKTALESHTHALSPENEMLKRLHGAYDQANKDLVTVEILYARGKITLGEYNDEIARNRDLLGEAVPSALHGVTVGPANANELPADAGQRAMNMNADPDKSGLFGIRADYTDQQKKTQAAYDAILKPQKDFASGQQALNELLALGKINVATYDDEISKLRTTYDATQKHSTDFATGLHHGWDSIVKDATDSAGQIETAMTGAFSAIEDSITSMVMKGQFDLNSLGSSLEQILIKLAVQQVVGAAVGSLPHFATGGSGTVGGSGGTDSQLFMARVTPGEQYTFTPPGQPHMASGGGGGGVVNHNYFTFDPKALNKQIEGGTMKWLRENRAAVKAMLG